MPETKPVTLWRSPLVCAAAPFRLAPHYSLAANEPVMPQIFLDGVARELRKIAIGFNVDAGLTGSYESLDVVHEENHVGLTRLGADNQIIGQIEISHGGAGRFQLAGEMPGQPFSASYPADKAGIALLWADSLEILRQIAPDGPARIYRDLAAPLPGMN